jgi:hypothetical protein
MLSERQRAPSMLALKLWGASHVYGLVCHREELNTVLVRCRTFEYSALRRLVCTPHMSRSVCATPCLPPRVYQVLC